MEKQRKPTDPRAPRHLSRFQKGVLVLLSLLFVGSVAARALASSGEPAGPAGPRSTQAPDGFLPRTGPQHTPGALPEEEPAALEGWLPLFTEGSFFALLGFALGYATRKLVKVLLIFVAIFFVGIQALAYADVMSVDWNRALELVNGLVLNLREDQPFTQVLKEKVPTFGALVAGYLLGFRRG